MIIHRSSTIKDLGIGAYAVIVIIVPCLFISDKYPDLPPFVNTFAALGVERTFSIVVRVLCKILKKRCPLPMV
jgi:hypothetical protein